MCDLYYRELHLNSDGFSRASGTRSHPIFDLKYPLEGVRYIGLKSFTLPITYYNVPTPESITITNYGVNGSLPVPVVKTYTLPRGHYLKDVDLARAIEAVVRNEGTFPLFTVSSNMPTEIPGRVRWAYSIDPVTLPHFKIEFSPWLKRLLGYNSGYVPQIETSGIHYSQNLTRLIEPFEIYVRSSLMAGNLHFSNVAVGMEQTSTANILAKIPISASSTQHKTVLITDIRPNPDKDHMHPFSSYSHLKTFDMYLTTGPSRLYPNGREIDLEGYPFSATLCLLTTTPT